MLFLASAGCGSRLWGFGPIQDAYFITGPVTGGTFAGLGVVISSQETCDSTLYQDEAGKKPAGSLCEGLSLLLENVGQADGFTMNSPVREILTFTFDPVVQVSDLWGQSTKQVYLSPCYGDDYPSGFDADKVAATVTLPDEVGLGDMSIPMEFEGDYTGSVDFYWCK